MHSAGFNTQCAAETLPSSQSDMTQRYYNFGIPITVSLYDSFQ